MSRCTRIVRVGLDLVEVDSVVRAIADHGERYLDRVYTPRERAQCNDLPASLAARFAAKEATMKVLRPESGDAVSWRSIEIAGRPTSAAVRLSGPAAALATAAGLDQFAVSVTSEGGMALAVVVAMRRGGCP